MNCRNNLLLFLFFPLVAHSGSFNTKMNFDRAPDRTGEKSMISISSSDRLNRNQSNNISSRVGGSANSNIQTNIDAPVGGRDLKKSTTHGTTSIDGIGKKIINNEGKVAVSNLEATFNDLSENHVAEKINFEYFDPGATWNSGDIKKIYSDNRLYHGTSAMYKANLREHGFDIERKEKGAIVGSGLLFPQEFVERSNLNHYFSLDKETAKDFAKFTSKNSPGLVRAIDVKRNSAINLEVDSDSSDGNLNPITFRTRNNIPASYVLDSKKSPPDKNSIAFQSVLKENGVIVTKEKAGRLLREVQSDSEDDFR